MRRLSNSDCCGSVPMESQPMETEAAAAAAAATDTSASAGSGGCSAVAAFDVDSYIGAYEGDTKLKRLQFIAAKVSAPASGCT